MEARLVSYSQPTDIIGIDDVEEIDEVVDAL